MTKGKGYQFFHPLPASVYESLKSSIEANGVLVPIVVDEKGSVLDGHHRRRICAELHIDCPTVVLEGLSEQEKEAVVLTMNALRRHLSGAEKGQAITRLRDLGWSTRRIAEAVGVSHMTVHRAGVTPVTPDPDPGGADAPPETARVPETPHTAPVEPAEEGTGDRKPQPAPTPRVTGKDGKSHPARRDHGQQSVRTDADDFKDRFWKEMEHTYKTLLEMNPARVVECAPLLDHKSLVDFARSLTAWATELQTAASTKPDLKVAR